MNLKLQNNQAQRITFKYGNCVRNTSRNDENEYYYTFDCEEGKLHANPHLCAAIAAAWPGRGGVITAEKLNNTRFEVEKVETADRYYDLEMKVWDNESRSFETVDFEILGLGEQPQPKPDAPGSPKEPPPPAPDAGSGTRGQEESPARATSSGTTMELLHELMKECIERAVVICPSEWDADQQQKVAVTLFMDARRARIVPESLIPEEPEQPEEVSPPVEVPPEDREPGTDDLPF